MKDLCDFTDSSRFLQYCNPAALPVYTINALFKHRSITSMQCVVRMPQFYQHRWLNQPWFKCGSTISICQYVWNLDFREFSPHSLTVLLRLWENICVSTFCCCWRPLLTLIRLYAIYWKWEWMSEWGSDFTNLLCKLSWLTACWVANVNKLTLFIYMQSRRPQSNRSHVSQRLADAYPAGRSSYIYI